MALSRLRIRLTAGYALVFLISLALVDGALYVYLRRQSDRQLSQRLRADTEQLHGALEREMADHPQGTMAFAASEAAREWPPEPEAFVFIGPSGERLASRGNAAIVAAAERVASSEVETTDLLTPGEHGMRAVRSRRPNGVQVVALTSLASTREFQEFILRWLLVTTPLLLVAGLAGGYALARLALRPAQTLGDRLDAIAPRDLSVRLPARQPPDELDRLAERFNALLERLDQASRQNRRFVRRVAHQIRTPLTLVLGEAGLGLDRPRAAGDLQEALRRIRAAGERMQRRVAELFLIAQAEAGEVVTMDDQVELDGLALGVADLMRSRATALGRTLELGTCDPVMVRGNADLLQEAAAELVENALRHGRNPDPVTIAAFARDGSVVLAVASAGEPIPAGALDADPSDESEHGLGLAIVHWVARSHSGRVGYQHRDGRNHFELVLPAD